MELADLGPPASLTATPRRLVLGGPGDGGEVRVRAHSPGGFAAQLGVGDVRVDWDERLVSVEPIATGRSAAARDAAATVVPQSGSAAEGWLVTARADDIATRVDFAVGGLATSVVVTVGTRTQRLAGADDAWRPRTARALGRLRAHGSVVHGGPADASGHDEPLAPAGDQPTHVELHYDFTGSTATRAVYADLAQPVPIDGQPTSLSVLIDADGSGTWPSLDCRDAEGTHIVLRGEHLTWHGPRHCPMPVPRTVAYPLTLHGFYLAETRPDRQHRGRIRFGDITADIPPHTDLTWETGLPFPVWYPPYDDTALARPPQRPRQADRPLFTGNRTVNHADTKPDSPASTPPPDGTAATPSTAHPADAASHVAARSGPLFTDDLTDRTWRFAVLSDTQFVAARPDDALVTAARTMLRDIAATNPELVLVNGDFVDEGAPADLQLARRILDEELAGGPPWVYVPGNHEVAGSDIATFTAVLGPARRVFDRRGVRFLTVDTSSLGIGAEQLAWLRAQLNRAAADDGVAAAVVAGHVPPHDPTGHQASRLADRAEAAALERALAGFATTGKGCAYLAGHAGGFATWLRDGVAYVVNGNSGKHPAAPPRRGGLLGWSECGVGPPRRRDRAELVRRAPGWLGVRMRWPGGVG